MVRAVELDGALFFSAVRNLLNSAFRYQVYRSHLPIFQERNTAKRNPILLTAVVTLALAQTGCASGGAFIMQLFYWMGLGSAWRGIFSLFGFGFLAGRLLKKEPRAVIHHQPSFETVIRQHRERAMKGFNQFCDELVRAVAWIAAIAVGLVGLYWLFKWLFPPLRH